VNGEESRAKVVLDTGVILQAALSDLGPAYRALRLVEAGEITAYVSASLRAEYEDVLTRPAIREKNPLLTEERARAMLARLDECTNLVVAPRHYVIYPRDPDDERVLDLAVEVRADYVVSRDGDLLDLDADADFRRRYSFLRVVNPVTLLRELGSRRMQARPSGKLPE
jgi:putative PIN family toxin of toxin-antitoxin system